MSDSEKIRVFRSLFRGRQDIHAERFTTRAGESAYAPVCGRKFNKEEGCRIGTMEGPCDGCPVAGPTPWSDETAKAHLQGRTTRGIYPLLDDNSCWFFAVDFDAHDEQDPEGPGRTWEEARRFRAVCDMQGFPAYIERLRSGRGYHVWIFFDSPIPAWKIRLLAREGLFPEAGLPALLLMAHPVFFVLSNPDRASALLEFHSFDRT